jgi:hypothetical protein
MVLLALFEVLLATGVTVAIVGLCASKVKKPPKPPTGSPDICKTQDAEKKQIAAPAAVAANLSQLKQPQPSNVKSEKEVKEEPTQELSFMDDTPSNQAYRLRLKRTAEKEEKERIEKEDETLRHVKSLRTDSFPYTEE